MAEILDRVRASLETIRGEAAAGEQARQLTPAAVDAIRGAGVFRMAMSRGMGGPELSPLDQFAVLEQLATADGAAGWCGMINCDGGFATAYLDKVVAKELYPSIDQPTVLVANPGGRAVAEGDGFRVSGQWPFASGSSHAEVFFLNCIVFDGDAMRMVGEAPAMRMIALPRASVEVLDTWHTTGLAATASNDVRVSDVVVPESRTFDLLSGTPTDPAALYQWRWFFITKMPAVPLGLARAAINEAVAVATTKVTMPAFALARDDAVVQDNIGRAEAMVRAARAYVVDSVGRTWDAVQRGSDPTKDEWVDTRLAITNAFTSSKQAVGLLYEALGTTGVYRRSVLDRYLRDTVTMAQHVVSQTKTYAAAGRHLVGLDPAMIGF